jgi:hypothetical protein
LYRKTNRRRISHRHTHSATEEEEEEEEADGELSENNGCA